MTIPPDLIGFAVALVGTLLLTVPVRRLALYYGMVDRPGPRKVHVSPIPLLGGIAIYLGFVLAILFTLGGVPHRQVVGILAGATLLAVVGLLDDGGFLHHQVKLFIGMPVAALFLLASGIRAQVLSGLIPGTAGVVLDGVLTVVWVVGITASFSILDHMDGLCAGIAAVAAGFFVLIAGLNGQTMVRTLAAAVLGAALGFLRWNFNPAKIFMGDGGAMFLGFLMATLALKIRPEGSHFPAAWLVPILILGVPRASAVHLARKRPHRASSLQSRAGSSRRRVGSLLPRGIVRRPRGFRASRLVGHRIRVRGIPADCGACRRSVSRRRAVRAAGQARKILSHALSYAGAHTRFVSLSGCRACMLD
jgi:UDP-GlcNAc:undecaprenyl-phosphate GlcNAc-1-phosphate transferase